MHPRDVKSPVNRTRNHRPLFVSPDSFPDDSWSVCEMEQYDAAADKWSLVVGMRWDGDRDNVADKGFPNSSGQGVWFIAPREIEQIIRANLHVLEMKAELAKARARAKKAKKKAKAAQQLQPQTQAA